MTRTMLVAAVLCSAAAAPASALTIPFPQRDGSLTPYTFDLGYGLMTLVYDTLTWRDARGVPRPWLAESVRTHGDGRRVVVGLRDGVRWHDGRRLTARDVAFTYRYMAARFHPRFTPQLEGIERVRAVGDDVVEFRLRRALPGFEGLPLADVPILPRHLWADLPAGQVAPRGLPIGSGPYRLAARRPDGGWRFIAAGRHVMGQPTVDRIDVPIVRDADAMLRSLRRRRVDMLPIPIPLDREGEVGGLGIRIARGPLYGATVLLLNLRREPFASATTRRAAGAAIDPRRVSGEAVPADHGVLHPEAPAALAEPVPRPAPSGLGGISVPVLAPANDPRKLELARRVVVALRAAGADARVVTRSRAQLGRAVGENGAAPRFTAAIWSLSPLSSEDPSFLSAEFGSTGPLNRSGYRSAEFDALALLGDAEGQQRLLAQDLPVIPIAFTPGAFPYRPAVHDGWVYVRGRGILNKRSFLPGARHVPRLPRGAAPVAAPSRGVPAGAIAAIALVMLALGLALVLVLDRRRRRD